MTNKTLSELEEHYGDPQLSEEGEPICGRGKKLSGICRFSAGWGTDHVGFGPCKYHDSEERMEIALPNKVPEVQSLIFTSTKSPIL